MSKNRACDECGAPLADDGTCVECEELDAQIESEDGGEVEPESETIASVEAFPDFSL